MAATPINTPMFHQARREAVRGYRWQWRRIDGKQWHAERLPIRFPRLFIAELAMFKAPRESVAPVFHWR
jgi:hypothetical protein